MKKGKTGEKEKQRKGKEFVSHCLTVGWVAMLKYRLGYRHKL